jgi:hypothetical protein
MAKIAICVPTRRNVSFRWSSALLSLVLKTMENHSVYIFHSEQFQIDLARTELVNKALDKVLNLEYIFFLDDDVRCPNYTLNKLVGILEEKTDKKVASGIYPVLKIETREIFPCAFTFVPDGIIPVKIDPEKLDLIDVDMVGLGCCLIRTEVFKKITDSWFSYISMREGEDFVFQGEDYFFFQQLAKHFKNAVIVDSSIWCIHEKRIDLNKKHMTGDLFG